MKKQYILVLLHWICIQSVMGNELIKVAHWQNSTQDILFATVNFDFAQSQSVAEVRNEEKDGLHTYEFFFPQAVVRDTHVQGKIDALHTVFNTNTLRMAIDTVTTPTPGIRIIVRFDVHAIELVYGGYDSVVQRGVTEGFDTGIVFALYNKPLIRKLDGKKYEPTIYSAWHEIGHGVNMGGCIQS